MADELDQTLSDYDSLVSEYARLAGPLDTFGKLIQDGIEIEDFARTKPGQILIGRSIRAARESLTVLVDAESTDAENRQAIMELRVQHRVLQALADVMKAGRLAQRRIELEDQTEEEEEESTNG